MVLGGGQDASAVTTTDHRAGKFEAKFYDKVNEYIHARVLIVFHRIWICSLDLSIV